MADATRSALIIANSEYRDAKLGSLRAPTKDAEILARVLGDPQIGDFDVGVSVNEPEFVARRKIEAFFKSRGREDLLLLHFSCHGVKDDDGHLYFATPDTELDSLDSTAISSDFVNRQMSRSLSRRIILLLDCCYSGAFTSGARARAGETVELKERFEGRGRAVLAASNAMEYSFEGDEIFGEASPSIFTAALAQGLETGEADRDQDHWISIDELYEYVYDAVRLANPRQNPRKWSDVEGQLLIARSSYRAPIVAAELPADLKSALESPYAGIREGSVAELTRLLRGTQPGLAEAARLALEELVDDDSRRVSRAAASALESDEAAPEERPPSTSQPRGELGSAPSTEPTPARGAGEHRRPNEGLSGPERLVTLRRLALSTFGEDEDEQWLEAVGEAQGRAGRPSERFSQYLTALDAALEVGETVELLAGAKWSSSKTYSGLLAVTDRRILLLASSAPEESPSPANVVSVPFTDVTRIRSGFAGVVRLRVTSGNTMNKAELIVTPARRGDELVAYVKSQIDLLAPPSVS